MGDAVLWSPVADPLAEGVAELVAGGVVADTVGRVPVGVDAVPGVAVGGRGTPCTGSNSISLVIRLPAGLYFRTSCLRSDSLQTIR